MYVQGQDLTWEQFEQKFHDAFDRDMTPLEHSWFHTIWEIAHEHKEGKTKSAAA